MINHNDPLDANGDSYDANHFSLAAHYTKSSSESNNTNPINGEDEKTEVWHGPEMAMNGLLRTMSRVKSAADVIGDNLSPSFSMGVEQIKKGYHDFKIRKITVRFITEITRENLSYCKELMKYVELRHMDNVRGNMALSETEYVATARLVGEAKPVTQTIYSNVKAILDQHKYFFENLWVKAVPALTRIREIEEGLPPIETKILDNNKDIQNHIVNCIEKTVKGLVNCTPIEGFQMLYNDKHFFQIYINLLSKYMEGKVKGDIRWVTYIEDKSNGIDFIKKFLDIGIKIRHVNNLPPLSFTLSETQLLATIEKFGNSKTVESVLYSTEPIYLMHFQSIFEELWRTGIDAQERIRNIDQGIVSETTKIVENPLEAKELLLHLIDKAIEEIMIVFPSFNTVKIYNEIGIIDSIKQKSQKKVRIRILSPINNTIKEILMLPQQQQQYIEDKNQNLKNVVIKEIIKQQDIKSTILVIDNKYLLAIELKDDSKKTFEETVGLSTYSTSRPTILSYISIFESLWTQTEMFDSLRAANEQLKIQDKLQKDFINMAAHELRTPSQAILGYAELSLLDFDIQDKDRSIRYLEGIFRNAERLTRLTKNILDVSKIESDSLRSNKKLFDLKEMISDTIEEFNSKLKKLQHKNIEIVFENQKYPDYSIKQNHNMSPTQSSLPSEDIFQRSFLVEADREQIEQVMVNLLDNAIKFTDKKIFVRIEKCDSQVVVKVKDNGPGINPEMLTQIFSKFVTTSDIGTGLGLFISKNIVEAHGGNIWARNNDKEKGVTFLFSIPSKK